MVLFKEAIILHSSRRAYRQQVPALRVHRLQVPAVGFQVRRGEVMLPQIDRAAKPLYRGQRLVVEQAVDGRSGEPLEVRVVRSQQNQPPAMARPGQQIHDDTLICGHTASAVALTDVPFIVCFPGRSEQETEQGPLIFRREQSSLTPDSIQM